MKTVGSDYISQICRSCIEDAGKLWRLLTNKTHCLQYLWCIWWWGCSGYTGISGTYECNNRSKCESIAHHHKQQHKLGLIEKWFRVLQVAASETIFQAKPHGCKYGIWQLQWCAVHILISRFDLLALGLYRFWVIIRLFLLGKMFRLVSGVCPVCRAQLAGALLAQLSITCKIQHSSITIFKIGRFWE